jgi:hypothetical protein
VVELDPPRTFFAPRLTDPVRGCVVLFEAAVVDDPCSVRSCRSNVSSLPNVLEHCGH